MLFPIANPSRSRILFFPIITTEAYQQYKAEEAANKKKATREKAANKHAAKRQGQNQTRNKKTKK